MNLLIVESPAKCKKIQQFLGKDFIVKSSYGHFRDLKKKELGIDIEKDFKPNYVLMDDKKKVINELKAAYKKSSNLYLAADNDREGEAIAWHLNEVLNKGKQDSKRVLFNEITKTALVKAVNEPIKININMFYAQQARRIIDRLVGFLISPCLWKNIQSTYKKGSGLSAGRVQSVVNKLIIERENNIDSFEKKSYYNLSGNLEFEKEQIPIKYPKKIDKEETIKEIFDLTKSEQFIVKDIKKKKKEEKAKAPFTTSSLQQEAHNKLSMSSKQTMMVAQKLYEGGHITYMRTDSIIIANDALKEIEAEIIKLYGKKYYKQNVYKTKTKNAQEAHECCRVTDVSVHTLPKGTHDEERLYKLIWKRTMASQMVPMVKDVLDVQINLDIYVFNSIYEKINFEGFMVVYGVNNETKNENLLKLKKDTILDFKTFQAEQKYTTPEARFNDSSLVKKLEDLGIGRPSTYANMINSVVDKNYAIIKDNEGVEIDIKKMYLEEDKYSEKIEQTKYGADKNKINPTQIGIIVNDYLVKYFDQIINYEFTAFMETQLDKVSEGDLSWNNIVNIIYTKIKYSIDNSPKQTIIKDKYTNILGTNPLNDKVIDIYIGQYGPVLREKSNEKGVKDRFISIKDYKMDTITLDKALELLKFPYSIGELDNNEILVDNGRFGYYIKYKGKNYTYSISELDNINIEEVKEMIKEKSKIDKYQKKINDKMIVQSGPYGYYIRYNNKTNYSIKFNNDFSEEEKKDYIENLTLSDCNKIIEMAKSNKGKKGKNVETIEKTGKTTDKPPVKKSVKKEKKCEEKCEEKPKKRGRKKKDSSNSI